MLSVIILELRIYAYYNIVIKIASQGIVTASKKFKRVFSFFTQGFIYLRRFNGLESLIIEALIKLPKLLLPWSADCIENGNC